MYKRGLDYFNEKYVDPSNLSATYLAYEKSLKMKKEFLTSLGARSMTEEEIEAIPR